MNWASISLATHLAIEFIVILRILLRPHREPASRIAWIAVTAAFPGVGVVAYVLLGETNIGRRRVAKMKAVLASLPRETACALGDEANFSAHVPDRYEHLFRMASSVSGFAPVGGNVAKLLADSNDTIDSMVADIDAATSHVHVLFYIWLPDGSGCKVVEALRRAAARGVKCRALADGLGSRLMFRSPHWQAMRESGVHVAVALPIGNPLLRPLAGRIDLRNHRKIVVIDGHITYCGSQNCADPEFRIKAKFAPWVDAMVRFEGPIVRQNQFLFASDWMVSTDEDISELLRLPLAAPRAGFPAQVIGTGPTVRHSAMPEMFETLIHAARHELVISTPYYVPDESMQNALCAAAYRGVKTTIIFPAKNDSRIVAAASRSYYQSLLDAGVEIHEFVGGLLHTKSLTLDGEVTLVGSANMDRRSFELNYENNILFYDESLTRAVRQRQFEYIAQSNVVTFEQVASWSVLRRLWNNSLAMLGPVL